MVRVAERLSERLRGLSYTEPSQPLLIPRCRSVHTFGMRYALDLYWLDERNDLVRLDTNVGPRRVRTCRRARSVLEVPTPR
jgi:uncharacterized membrane protein (UPF0127 family)